jgi:periplasmic protein TonB
MFATLLESRRVVRWPIGNGALSVFAHAAVISAAVGLSSVTIRGENGEPAPSAPAERITYATVEAADPGKGGGPRVARRVNRVAPPAEVPLELPPVPDLTEELSVEALTALLEHDFAAFDADLQRLVSRTDEFERFGDEGLGRRRLEALARHVAGTPWHATDVERMAVPFDDNPRPRYPFSLLSMGVEGNVVVQFVVDSTGKAEMRSLRIVRSTHELFTRAVRAVLPRLRFLPAEVGGNRVDVLVEQPFQFSVR